jgi:hypothetical protein
MNIKSTGTCTECGKENVQITILDDVERLCDQCLDSLYQECDICHEYYDPGSVEFSLLKNEGIFVCEYCAEDFDEDDFEEVDDDE